MLGKLASGVAILLGGTFLASTANAQTAQSPCPTFANTQSSGCGAVVTVTGTQAMLAPGPAGGPYDGSDDTLVGVVNSIPNCTTGMGSSTTVTCGISIYSLDLTSTNDICGFDGDGIDAYGAARNAMDGTGYGGPHAYFTPIPPATSINPNACRVNFMPPIPPNGGVEYFSLENKLTNATNACTNLINNSVPAPTLSNGNTRISTTFTPNGNDPNTGQPWKLDKAAAVCGFNGWEWQQTITALPNPRPQDANGNGYFNDAKAPTVALAVPFNDPPPDDYFYATVAPNSHAQPPGLRVYYSPFDPPSEDGSLAVHLVPPAPPNTSAISWFASATAMNFSDLPKDSCLTDATGGINSSAAANTACGGTSARHRADVGKNIAFTTHLVGLQGQFPGAAIIDTGIGFNWITTYNNTSGGISVLRGDSLPNDPGPATGGISVTSYTPTSTYTGVGVSGINGSTSIFAPTTLVAAVLPASRSVTVNGTATAFATIINTGAATATACSIAPSNGLPLTFHYRTTDPKTNAVIGTLDTSVDIPAGGSQSFVIALTPTAAIAPTNAAFNFGCVNTSPAPIVIGLSTLLLSGSTTATPDVVALAATATSDGILHIPGSSGTGAFATATVNVGAGGAITASANTGSGTLPLALTICQSNPVTGACLAPPAATVATNIAANATPTFSIFATASGAIPFDPANSRIFVVFSDSANAVRGETSVAVQTQ